VGWLVLLFILLPAVELALLIRIGTRIGTLPTLALIVATGLLGATLARQQGLGVLRTLQQETAAGRMPAGAVVDGAFILVAAALLVTPGVLTDAVGFACLVPAFREAAKRAMGRRLERAVAEGRVQMHVYGAGAGTGAPREEKVVRDVRDAGQAEERDRLGK
jgi:UPF0716 protein FxsA